VNFYSLFKDGIKVTLFVRFFFAYLSKTKYSTSCRIYANEKQKSE